MMEIRILDLDGSLPDQTPIAERLQSGQAVLHDLRSLGSALRLWARRQSYAAFDAFWRGPTSPSGPALILVGSGDFHHLTASFIASAQGPLTVVHFDKPSEIHTAVNSGAGHVAADGFIRWRNLIDEDWDLFLGALMERAPTRRIWITIDKDVLPPTEAVTNWDQGGLPLQRLIEAIQRLAARFTIVGADICGEYAPIHHRNPFKIIESRLDQPRFDEAPDLSVNARTNERLIAAFEAAL
jgi:hypothetical protein